MKRILITILSIITLFSITGCDKKEQAIKENKNEIVISDKGTGYTTTFSYPKKDNYDVAEELGGKFVELIIKNEEKNIKFDVYYFEMPNSSYEKTKDSRKTSDGFKDYKWNNYDGYVYNVSNYSLNFNIMLKEVTDKDMCVGLFGEVTPIDYTDSNIIETFESSEIQKLLNTIEFEIK